MDTIPYNVKIMSLFPTAVMTYESGLSSCRDSELEYIANELDNPRILRGNYGSGNNYVLEAPELKRIRKAVDGAIDLYSKKVINTQDNVNLYVTQSWLTLTPPGGSHHEHAHTNSILSGVFYVQTVSNDKIVFHDSRRATQQITLYPKDAPNEYNAISVEYPVRQGEVVIFPSHLKHSVMRNDSDDKDRIVIAFNVFAKGALGGESTWNALYL
jgi:uncharacterized protein (TIGR02466 family)